VRFHTPVYVNRRGTLEFLTVQKPDICLRAISAGLSQLWGYSADRSGYEEYTAVCSWASLLALTRVVAIHGIDSASNIHRSTRNIA
jgi:hypothetical protein